MSTIHMEAHSAGALTSTDRNPRAAPEFPTYPCACYLGEDGCICQSEERALRHIAAGNTAEPMTAEQREWCKREIVSVEGYAEKDAEGADADVARTVLHAWVDYCRDKGLMD